MTANDYLEIGKVLGVPAAVAFAFLLMGFAVLMASIKGVKWLANRTIGEGGMATKLVDRHMEFMDVTQANDDRHTESLNSVAESMRAQTDTTRVIGSVLNKLVETNAQHQPHMAQKLEEIHQEIKEVKNHVKGNLLVHADHIEVHQPTLPQQ